MLNDGERIKLGNKVLAITIALNVLLTIIKVIGGLWGNSSAMVADGLHSLSDVITSMGIIISLFISSKPRDEEHPYGHEKAESIASFLLALVLATTGAQIGYHSINTIIHKTYAQPEFYTIIVAIISVLIKEYQYRITISAAKKINSNAMMSDAWHHRSDAFSSIAALIGIIGSRLGYSYLDPLAGIIVSVIVVKVGIELLLQAVHELMDGSIGEEEIEQIKDKVKEIKGVRDINQLRGRKHGSKANLDINICVDPNITVYEGHRIGDIAQKDIKDNFANINEIIVHIDPCIHKGSYECKQCKRRKV
ncbi:cation diffusion facilitator family transporter [Anaeromicrobium sediminis]|uniref:Cation diffusion facilitator family transporter n=1 Tax=Anaeromicrobium sediminis TaxID=1478221 RepID=A0A267MIZ0_9FIRM|nr:cation diffusion facilitator family transporter [Anaeromicrobium sediminis]PAB59554.1 cation diffusion facilitator family transporter [Anaeromicrobium sediminis]